MLSDCSQASATGKARVVGRSLRYAGRACERGDQHG